MLLIALALGLIASLGELAFLAWRALVLDRFIFAGPDITWLVPASNLVLFGVAGGAAAAGLVVAPRARRLLLAGLVSLCAFALAFLFHPSLHLAAAALLAAGIGWQASPLFDRRFADATRWSRRAVITGGVVTALVAGMMQYQAGREEAGGDTAGDFPSIILLILDTVRASALSAYGYERETSPVLESLAGQGALFEAAISPSSWTLPAHAAMFTGLAPHELLANWEHPLEPGPPTLAAVLAEAGYRTGGFSGNVAYVSRETGLARGFAHFEDHVPHWSDLVTAASLGRFFSNNPRLRALIGYHDVLGRRAAPDLNTAALAWLDRAGRHAAPFFLMVNYYDAHEPYLPPAAFRLRFGSTEGRDVAAIRQINARLAERAGKEVMPAAQGALERLAYDQSIAALDADLGVLVDSLRARGLLDNAILVVTSDHGEQFGERGLFSHGNGLYMPSLHVPLIVVAPGRVPAGTRRPDVVSTQDLGATLLSLAGVVPRAPFPGSSLFGDRVGTGIGRVARSSIRPAANQSPTYPSYHGAMYSATTDSLQVILSPKGEEVVRWRVAGESAPASASDSLSPPAAAARQGALDAARAERIPAPVGGPPPPPAGR